MKTLSELAPQIIALVTPAQADEFVTERIVARREVAGETRPNEELDALERSSICAWFARFNHQHHARLVELFGLNKPPRSPLTSHLSLPTS